MSQNESFDYTQPQTIRQIAAVLLPILAQLCTTKLHVSPSTEIVTSTLQHFELKLNPLLVVYRTYDKTMHERFDTRVADNQA